MSANWSGTVNFRDAQRSAPTSIDEMQELISKSARVRARGSAHCFNDIADTSATAITFENMPSEIEINKEKRTVRVPAGMKYGELAVALHDRGIGVLLVFQLRAATSFSPQPNLGDVV